MKTMGQTLAGAKYILPVITVLALSPAYAQLSYALQKNKPFTNGERVASLDYTSIYSPKELMAGLNNIAAMAFTAEDAKPSKRNGSSDISVFEDKPDKKKLSVADKANWFDLGDLKVSFRTTSYNYPERPGKEVGLEEYSMEQLILYARVLKAYAKENDLDTSYAILSNMGLLTTKKRFFLVNLETMRVEDGGMVAQGRGLGATRFDKQYSNTKDSKCTSLGKYKILNKYKGEYGDAYRLTGLDTSNDNAYSRNIVLHAMGCIPDKENQQQVCISEGCPAISVNLLERLEAIIDTREKSMLLWIYDSNLEEVLTETVVHESATALGEEPASSYHSCTVHHYLEKSFDL